MNCNALLINSTGATAASTGTLSNGNDGNGPAVINTTTTTINNAANIRHSTFNTVQRQHAPTLFVKFQINQTTNTRFWCGLFAAAPSATSDSLGATNGAGIRYTPGTDADWQFVSSDGTSTPLDSGIPVTSGVHTLRMTLEAGGNMYFQIDNQPVQLKTTNPPGSSQDLGFAIQVTNTAGGGGSARSFTLHDVWCEYNA